MSSRRFKFPARKLVLAAGMGVIGSFAMAGSALAAAPTAGTNCVPDSKFDGNGSTLQAWLVNNPGAGWNNPGGLAPQANANGSGLISNYAQAVCGSVGADPLSFSSTGAMGAANDQTDPGAAVNVLTPFGTEFRQDESATYNYIAAQTGSPNNLGSGAGRASISCRIGAFGGTDAPYTVANFNNMSNANGAANGFPGKQASGLTTGSHPCNLTGGDPPFAPQPGGPPSGTFTSTYPNPGDGPGKLMNFPVGVSAVAIPVNLPSYCLNTGGTLYLTSAMMQGIWGGSTLNWPAVDPTGAVDPNLPNCMTTQGGTTPLAITRVVRQDDSGTTQGFDNYLADAFGTAATCSSVNANNATFAAMRNNEVVVGNNNTQNWPGGPQNSAPPAGCSAVISNSASGAQNLLNTLEVTTGGIGYGDYSDVYHDNNTPSVLTTTTQQASDGTASVLPNAGGFANSTLGTVGLSNCGTGGATITAGGTNGAVGLGGQWALDFTAGSVNAHDDVAWTTQGNKYPICSLTWDMMYAGENGNTAPVATTPASTQTIPATTITVLGNGTTSNALGAVVGGNTNGWPNSGTMTFTDSLGAVQVATYSGITGPTWPTAGCPAGGCTLTGVTFKTTPGASDAIPASAVITVRPADLANGDQTEPASTLVVGSTAGFPSSGTVTAGSQTLTYSGIAGNTLTGVLGGVAGTITNGTPVVVTSAAGLGGPEPNLSADQRKNIYAFWTYMLSPAGQLSAAGNAAAPGGYAPLPVSSGYLDAIRKGFQANF